MYDPALLVGLETSDDAAVYKINETTALIQTVDFFTPIVDDPYTFGQIAACNALSDVYAMGGEPLLALNIACFPTCLDTEILSAILEGGASKVREAGARLAGGHTVMDEEPKYGLSVTGLVHPNEIWKNSGAKEGDVLILTKPLGTGIITTAAKVGVAGETALNAAVCSMSSLHKDVCKILKRFEIHGCTDITGFSLLGHAMEMAKASNTAFDFYFEQIPFLPDTISLAGMDLIPGGAYRNREYLENDVLFKGISEMNQDVLFNPETSGGLLVSIAEKEATRVLDCLLEECNTSAKIIGSVKPYQNNPYRLCIL